jgi:hypothetical protein
MILRAKVSGCTPDVIPEGNGLLHSDPTNFLSLYCAGQDGGCTGAERLREERQFKLPAC